MTDEEEYMVWYNRAEGYIWSVAMVGTIIGMVGVAIGVFIIAWIGASAVVLHPIVGYFVAKISVKNPGILGPLYFIAQADACKTHMRVLVPMGILIVVTFLLIHGK